MAGELHSTSDIPADQIKFLKEKLGDQVKISPYLGTWYLAVNTSKKPFNDVRVRQALSMVIDREFIADEIWQGTMLPAYSFVPPGIGNYGEPADRRLQGPLADRPRGQGEGAAEGGRLRAGQAAQGRDPLQHHRQQPNTVVAIAQPVEGDRRRDELHQHRRQDPLRATCATAATSTSPAPAGSATTPTRRTSCSCVAVATTRASTTPSTRTPNTTR